MFPCEMYFFLYLAAQSYGELRPGSRKVLLEWICIEVTVVLNEGKREITGVLHRLRLNWTYSSHKVIVHCGATFFCTVGFQIICNWDSKLPS